MHAPLCPFPYRSLRRLLVASLCMALSAVTASAREARPPSERPLLTILHSTAFPAHCDVGGCVPSSIVDTTLHLLHDGGLIEIDNGGTETEPFWSHRIERRVGSAGLRELRRVLNQLQELEAGECEVATPPPHGEETWIWYRTAPGSRHRFRMHLAPAGSTGLKACPAALLDLRSQGYLALRPR
jgi:hypothetical protein